MKIQREVNGAFVEFELTPEELSSAYCEQQHLFDVQNVRDKLEGEMDPYEVEDEYGVPPEVILSNESLLDEIGRESRLLQDRDGKHWDTARDEAISNVLERRREEPLQNQKAPSAAAKVYPGLPESCFSVLPSTGELIVIRRGETGYYKSSWSVDDFEKNREMADWHNKAAGITKAQAAAMSAGSMFGWDVPAANPEMYDENGRRKQASLDDQIAKCAVQVAAQDTAMFPPDRDIDL